MIRALCLLVARIANRRRMPVHGFPFFSSHMHRLALEEDENCLAIVTEKRTNYDLSCSIDVRSIAKFAGSYY